MAFNAGSTVLEFRSGLNLKNVFNTLEYIFNTSLSNSVLLESKITNRMSWLELYHKLSHYCDTRTMKIYLPNKFSPNAKKSKYLFLAHFPSIIGKIPLLSVYSPFRLIVNPSRSPVTSFSCTEIEISNSFLFQNIPYSLSTKEMFSLSTPKTTILTVD